MRIATLEINGRPSVAFISADGRHYCNVSRILPEFSGAMLDLIKLMPVFPCKLEIDDWTSIEGADLKAPIPTPSRNIFCVGKNYHDHAMEFSKSGFDTSAGDAEIVPTVPVIFTKASSCVVGDGAVINSFSHLTSQLDYEAELVVVIGKQGRGIRKADALSHVWGYTIANDVTARDLQRQHRQWFLGKSLDTFCPLGPWITTVDEVDARALELSCWVNGELRQQASTRDLIFDIPTIIETLSAGITLEPGDLIATGTPAGVGIGFEPPKFLKRGDVIKISVEALGTLTNTVS
jgi:2-keto-4-pentenoate hydratase/2-oxohepta-3-ene-1,7-dioic acid hydratase in catechol pathway